MTCTSNCNQGRNCTCMVTVEGFGRIDTKAAQVPAPHPFAEMEVFDCGQDEAKPTLRQRVVAWWRRNVIDDEPRAMP